MPPHIVQPDEYVDPQDLVPLNGVDSEEFFRCLLRDMRRRGWHGRPLLATESDGVWYAITGSHRIAAAREVGIRVPVVWWPGAWWAARCDSAVDLYLQTARHTCPDPTYPDERIWWLLRMEGQEFIRNGG